LSGASQAVFVSYASQDAEAAGHICEALRAAGIEVWFDQSELRGGDAWDQSIRKQIKTCALFVPVISQHTHERAEGYFRLEWKLAVDRCHLMAADKAFLVPVVIDDTSDDDERVPEKFREVQWTRLPRGETPPDFAARIAQLLSGELGHSLMMTRPHTVVSGRPSPSGRWPALVAVLAAVAAYLLVEQPWIAKPTAPARQTAPAETPVAFTPPAHSIAVLPFVNMSGDKEQEYFSDGLTEELLNSLARINELQVAARTSAFSFKGKDADIGTIARKLNVGAVLEGSVRRSGRRLRITAQLNSAVTGFHLWSQTYDRDLGDVLMLQTEIANAVANALKVTLLGNSATKIALGGTNNPEAFDAYLRASRAFKASQNEKDVQSAVGPYTAAIRLDPQYALAYAARSIAYGYLSREFARGPAARDYGGKAVADARKANSLAPDLAEGHLALGYLLENSLEYRAADHEYRRAVALTPGDAKAMKEYGRYAVFMGQYESGLAAVQRAVVLDPLNSSSYDFLGESLTLARRYRAAIEALNHAKALGARGFIDGWLGYAYYKIGDLENARASCESEPLWNRFICLAMVYNKLGRHGDARDMMAKFRASEGDAAAVFYACIYTEWGDHASALDWLETAMRQRSPFLEFLKATESFDPLRKEPRFQAIEQELKFPT
jgi:TolB-like protein/Flp pilus assembly protein TadD